MLENGFFRKGGVIWVLLLVVLVLSLSVAQAEAARKVPLRIITVKSLSEAKNIISRLKNGVSFNTLVSERTSGGARGKDGELAPVDVSTLEPPLRKAVSRMKEGDISGPVKLRKNRYAIVQIPDFSYYRKGAAAFRAVDFTAAGKDLLKHIKLNPDALMKARIMLAEIYEHDKNSDKAEAPLAVKDDRSMHLRMVVVGSESEAGDILSDLKKGRPFSMIAREKTLDENSRGEYGYLGELKIKSLDKPILNAVRNLKVGQISGIVKLGEKRYAIMQAADFHYYEEAEKAFIEEDFRTAEKKLLKHLELNQGDAKAYLMLGKIYEDRKEPEKAEEMYRKGISFHPRVVLLYLRLGKLYQSQRQFQKSKDIYVEGLRNVPSSELLAQGVEMVDILLFGEGGKRQ